MQITLVFLFSMKYQYNVVLTIADSKIICSWVLEQVDVANPNYSTMLVLPNVYFCHLSFICNMTTILYKVISTLYLPIPLKGGQHHFVTGSHISPARQTLGSALHSVCGTNMAS